MATADDLEVVPNGQHVRYAGIIALRQQPELRKARSSSARKTRRGVVQVSVWKSLRDQQRAEMLKSELLAAYGKWQREGDLKNLISARLEDRSHLLRHLRASSRGLALATYTEQLGGLQAQPIADS